MINKESEAIFAKPIYNFPFHVTIKIKGQIKFLLFGSVSNKNNVRQGKTKTTRRLCVDESLIYVSVQTRYIESSLKTG